VRGNTRYLRFFNHEIHEKARNFFYRVVALTDGIASGILVWFVVSSDCLAFLAFLAVGSSLLNRQDAKIAKVGFMELSRLFGYKALS